MYKINLLLTSIISGVSTAFICKCLSHHSLINNDKISLIMLIYSMALTTLFIGLLFGYLSFKVGEYFKCKKECKELNNDEHRIIKFITNDGKIHDLRI